MENQREMAAFFDRLAPNWMEDKEEEEIRDEIIERSQIPPGAVIADLGCGQGVMVPHLLKTSPQRIMEVDLSPEMIRLGRERWAGDRLEFICADALEMEWEGLDAAVIFNAYPHFLDKKGLARKLAKGLKPGGMVVIAHSKGRMAINQVHREGISQRLSVNLKPPLEEYEAFRQDFYLESSEDSHRMYYMKLVSLGARNRQEGEEKG